MPITPNFPTSVDNGTSLPSPTDVSYTNAPDHAQLHAAENQILIALETKLGFGASTPTSGTSGYLLTSNGDGSSSWTAPPVSAVWGLISGTLSNQTDLATALAGKLALAGGTLTGPLILAADPATALGAATKQYVDAQDNGTLVQNEVPGGSINGSNTAFTTASTFVTGSLRVYLNGQRLIGGGADYTEGTQAFTMAYAPVTGDLLIIDYNVTNTHFIQGSNSNIVQETPTGSVNGSNTSFTTLMSKYVANTLQVYLNGVQQTKTTDYAETTPGSGIFTFVTAPVTGDAVRVGYQFSTGAAANADTVDGIHANATATANDLYPLDGNAHFPSALLNNAYKFSVYRNGALSPVTDVVIPFDTKVFDTGSNYSTSTGLFTAPVAGFYFFQTSLFNSGSTIYYITEIIKNGVVIQYLPGTNLSSNPAMSGGSTILQLAAGDTIGIASHCSSTVALQLGLICSYFNGFLISVA